TGGQQCAAQWGLGNYCCTPVGVCPSCIMDNGETECGGLYCHASCFSSNSDTCVAGKGCRHLKSGCFVAGTKILLADGSIVEVQNIKVGDVLSGSKGAHNKV